MDGGPRQNTTFVASSSLARLGSAPSSPPLSPESRRHKKERQRNGAIQSQTDDNVVLAPEAHRLSVYNSGNNPQRRPVSTVFTFAASTSAAAIGMQEAPPAVPFATKNFEGPLHNWDGTGESMQHIWYPQEGRKSDICSRCKSKFSRLKKDGYKCASCHMRIHKQCSPDGHNKACRPQFVQVSDISEPREATIHHWVAGIFEQTKQCDVCNKWIGKLSGAKSVAQRCAWCKRTVHKACLEKMIAAFKRCDMGMLRPVVLPATAIILAPPLRRKTMRRYHSDIHAAASDDESFRRDLSSPDSSSKFDDVGLASTAPIPSRNLERTGSITSGGVSDGSLEIELDDDVIAGIGGPPLESLTASQKKSLKRSLKRKRREERVARGKPNSADLMFHIQAPPDSMPLVVFINPKSGGNQGVKLLTQFQWLLNPRQVFNIMATDKAGGKPFGPARGLEIFKNVENLRILVCGGDGTVGWLLETIDDLKLSHLQIPIATIPLGTGNDLARALKWGGGYEGAPLLKIVTQVIKARPMKMDRWEVAVTPRPEIEAPVHDEVLDTPIQTKGPVSVLNNYFSIGSDALTSLRFHLDREANPKGFDSRMGNKMHYGILGAKEIFQHQFRNLSREMTLSCDGTDYTHLLQQKNIEAVAFLNINSYAAGTRPWGTKDAVDEFVAPSMSDGKLEVVGFQNAWEMAKGIMGLGHALRICQCSEVEIVTNKPLPVQIDGEPCMLAPSIINISFRNQATMLQHVSKRSKSKSKGHSGSGSEAARNAIDTSDEEDAAEFEGHNGQVISAAMGSRADLMPVNRLKVTDRQFSSQSFGSTMGDDYWSNDEGPTPSSSAGAAAAAAAAAIAYEKVNVYLVPMENGHTGTLKKLGPVNISLEATLFQARDVLSSQLPVEFSHSEGWRFLQFRRGPVPGGAYYVITHNEEPAMPVRVFARPEAGIKSGLFVTRLPSANTGEGATQKVAFFEAVAEGEIDQVQVLLDKGFRVNTSDSNKQTALHIAAANNHIPILSLLLNTYKVDVNLRDCIGRTALHCAAVQGHMSACEVLLDAGAEPMISDSCGQRPEDLASHENHKEIMRLLLSLQAEHSSKQPDLETIV